MNRYCKVSLLNSVTAENIIKQIRIKNNSNIDHNTVLSQKRKHIKKNSNSTNNFEQININKNKGNSCSSEHISDPQRKVKKKSLRSQNPLNKEVDKKTVIQSQKENCILPKNNENYSKSMPRTTRKRLSLEGEHSLYCKKKRSPKPQIDEDTENSKETKQKKSNKKRNTHIIIWESKLTGAQRVSKRLSNLRTKNKTSGTVESFNLFPVALIKKCPVKQGVQNKMKKVKRTIINNKSKKDKIKTEQILVVHNDQTERCDSQNQTMYRKTPLYKNKRCIIKLSPEITLKNQFVQSKTKSHESKDSIDTTQISDTLNCVNAHFNVSTASEIKFETDSTTCAKSPEETETLNTSEGIEEINIIKNIEPIKCINEENINIKNFTETNEVLQEDCLVDSDIIIVQLEPVENVLMERPKEKTDASSSECHSNVKEDISTNILEITSDAHNCLKSTDLIKVGGKSKIYEEACDKEHANNTGISKTGSIPVNKEMEPEESIREVVEGSKI